METSVIDLEDVNDDEQDVFVLKQVKPINKLTVQQALLIKHNVLQSVKSKGSSSKKETKKHTEINEKQNSGLKQVRPKARKSKEVFKNSCTVTDQSVFNESCSEIDNINVKEDEKDTVQMSPGIKKKRKRFLINENESPKQSPKKGFRSAWSPKNKPISSHNKIQHNTEYRSTNSINKTMQEEPLLESNESPTMQDSTISGILDDKQKYFDDNGELLGFLLKKIVSEVTENQLYLESRNTKQGRNIEKLFSSNEQDILEKFSKLEGPYCKVFVRLLCRSRLWFRISTIYFKDVNTDLENIFNLLHSEKLVHYNIEDEDLRTQMELLSKSEIQKLCRAFMMSGKACSSTKKMDLVDTLVASCQGQKNVMNMFCKGNNVTLIDKLKKEVIKILGLCARFDSFVKATFKKVILLFSFPHYHDEEEKRFRNQLYMCMSLYKGFVKFPNYKLSRTVVFTTVEDFKHFSEALEMKEAFENAIFCKQHKEFIAIMQKAKENFKRLTADEKYINRYMNLKHFLKRFSGGHIYAKLLTKFCCTFKTKTNNMDIIEVAQMLLDQNMFLISKRGKWYEILSQALESNKNCQAAAELLIKAQNDPFVGHVEKLTLQLRGQALLRKKTNGIVNAQIREVLDDVCTVAIEEPPSIEISGKALQGNKSGYKTVYVENTENGKMYTSVEERALLHYKQLGYTKGYHVEGFIVQSLFAFLFFDIIYEMSPVGVFLNFYQEVPLDLYSESFYTNRQTRLDRRLFELTKWTEEEVENKIKSVYHENYNVQCLITWKEHFTADLFCEIMRCLTPPILSEICKRFVMNYRLAQSGFPDLTLWNPETKKCKFVEVKSPNDKLSSQQRIWLHFLRNIGIDCEVCNVKNISRKLQL
ncbi:hypothetical protein RUM43_004233 [Polyplax serrata]|uniref:Fanconi-associated nuclease n=1 Tax=Polyplax serrata TaxID=468196 RepID=A0AAN8XMU9_POLSC